MDGHDHHHHGAPGHGHAHGRGAGAAGRFLGAAFWGAVLILLAEVGGGLLSHSLALLSDAGHMLTDVLALGLSWYAVRLSRRPATPQRTYGFHRAGILVALLNAGTLIVIAGAILAEAVARFLHPVPVHAGIMWVVAAVGLTGNLVIGQGLGHDHAHGGENLNVRSAWLHVMGDAAASAGVLLAGVAILVTHRLWIDPAVSAGIALLLAWGARGVVVETVDILMEGTPRGLDPEAVAAAMSADPEVVSVHHVHVWGLGSGQSAMSGHVVVGDGPLSAAQAVRRRIEDLLVRDFHIEHTTLQLETVGGMPCAVCGEEPAAVAARAGTAP